MTEYPETVSQPIPVTLLKESTLVIGTMELPCAIAHDQEGHVLRLLRQRQMAEALGHHRIQPTLVQSILMRGNFKDYISEDLVKYAQVYTWKLPIGSGTVPKASRAELLPALCVLYLKARDAGLLHPWQGHIADRCYQIVLGLANVGIVALVDEATGYQ
jgi:hypothetical protein